MRHTFALVAAVLFAWVAGADSAPAEYSPYVGESYPQQLLWGDTHVHSSFSMDANVMRNTRLDPGNAYRFARGETVEANSAQSVRLDRPLDFLVVSDHAEYMGVLPKLRAEDPVLLADPDGLRIAEALTGALESGLGSVGGARDGRASESSDRVFIGPPHRARRELH